MDFITGFPMTLKKNDSLMVVVEKLLKAIHFSPVNSTHKATYIGNILVKEVFRLHGLPKEIVSDRYVSLLPNFGKGYFRIWELN